MNVTIPKKEVTRELNQWKSEGQAVSVGVMELIYQELCLIARSQLKKERMYQTFTTEGLVNEAYLRLNGTHHVVFESRAHFYGIAARIMRQILIDHARQHLAEKRGGRYERVYLENFDGVQPEKHLDILKLDAALEKLSEVDPEKAKMVELRYFGGLTIEETADFLSISPATLKRDWNFTKAWLRRWMHEDTSQH